MNEDEITYKKVMAQHEKQYEPLEHPLTEEELFLEEVLQAQEEALEKERIARLNGENLNKRAPLPVRFLIYAMAIMLSVSTVAFIAEFISIPAYDFIKKSTELSKDPMIQDYKKAVVTISTSDSKGTGFSITEDGYIVTNSHVIEDALTISVIFPDQPIMEATVIKDFPEADLAILKVESNESLPAIPLGEQFNDSYSNVQFIGNPLRFTGIANEGEALTAVKTDLSVYPIILDAPVYKGNSGSPVFNNEGFVIGIIYATANTKEYGKVGLMIPIEALHERYSIPNE